MTGHLAWLCQVGRASSVSHLCPLPRVPQMIKALNAASGIVTLRFVHALASVYEFVYMPSRPSVCLNSPLTRISEVWLSVAAHAMQGPRRG